MTLDQACILTGVTGKTLTHKEHWGDFQAYASKLMGRGLYTHEMSMYADEIMKKSRKDFEDHYDDFDKTELAYVEIRYRISLLHEEDKHIVIDMLSELTLVEIFKRFYMKCLFPPFEEKDIEDGMPYHIEEFFRE